VCRFIHGYGFPPYFCFNVLIAYYWIKLSTIAIKPFAVFLLLAFASYLNGKLKANTRYTVFQRSFDEDGYYENEGFFQSTTKAKFPTAIVSFVVVLVVLLILDGAFTIWRRCHHVGKYLRNCLIRNIEIWFGKVIDVCCRG